jgi:hypothetical protein
MPTTIASEFVFLLGQREHEQRSPSCVRFPPASPLGGVGGSVLTRRQQWLLNLLRLVADNWTSEARARISMALRAKHKNSVIIDPCG